MFPHMIYAGSLMFSPPAHPVNLHGFSQWWTFGKWTFGKGAQRRIPTKNGASLQRRLAFVRA